MSSRFLLDCGKQLAVLLLLTCTMRAQSYSPKLLGADQPDASNLKAFADGIVRQAQAHTPREKAEAIWRFFLTDGRFVKPGFFYHIAGWTYEEPMGEVLDPIKLLNSYGFGLCYHIAPLLEAIFEAAGFADARCWFLTGHTVAEVFYEGGYHYFDSDMMGYNVAGTSGFRGKPVSSVHDIERDGNILLDKLSAAGVVKRGAVDNPWYPADVQAHAIGDLAGLFTTTADNRLYPYTRFAEGHHMDFVLRKGETLTRYFEPEEPSLYYLPYKSDGASWSEFPQPSQQFHIRTEDGPRSQKDGRTWATGRIDYEPPVTWRDGTLVVPMPSPYVIIDAAFRVEAQLRGSRECLKVETSVDSGRSWRLSGELRGPYRGTWRTAPQMLVKSAHGSLTAVSGGYGYWVRFTRTGAAVSLNDIHLTTRFELNPRSLPSVSAGDNRFEFSTGVAVERVEWPAGALRGRLTSLQIDDRKGQRFYYPQQRGETGYALYRLEDADPIASFSVGARFLDMPDGIAPDKFTAEVRQSDVKTVRGSAGIAWATAEAGPYHELWNYPQEPQFRDGQAISRLLRWPEVYREVAHLPWPSKCVFIKIYTAGPAFDSVRFAIERAGSGPSGHVRILQRWHENGVVRERVETLDAGVRKAEYHVRANGDIRNDAVIFSCR